MTSNHAASWAYAEDFVTEPEEIETARRNGEHLGATAVTPAVGAALRALAAACQARAVVEVGTGSGVSGLWLLDGMPADGVLTTIDSETDHQQAAKDAFAAAGVPHITAANQDDLFFARPNDRWRLRPRLHRWRQG